MTTQGALKKLRQKKRYMTRKQLKESTKKTIYNPVTDTYYEIASKSTKYGKKGEIKGMWSK